MSGDPTSKRANTSKEREVGREREFSNCEKETAKRHCLRVGPMSELLSSFLFSSLVSPLRRFHCVVLRTVWYPLSLLLKEEAYSRLSRAILLVQHLSVVTFVGLSELPLSSPRTQTHVSKHLSLSLRHSTRILLLLSSVNTLHAYDCVCVCLCDPVPLPTHTHCKPKAKGRSGELRRKETAS